MPWWVDRASSGHGAATAAALKHPGRRLRPLRHLALGCVVPADQRRREGEQPGGSEDGEEHRGRHPQPSRHPIDDRMIAVKSQFFEVTGGSGAIRYGAPTVPR
ncbi:hypothetical protein JCM9534A_50450 [Catenuloplanes indicus JCM 9534]